MASSVQTSEGVLLARLAVQGATSTGTAFPPHADGLVNPETGWPVAPSGADVADGNPDP